MMRCTVTDVAWFTLAQPTAVATAGADDEAGSDAAVDVDAPGDAAVDAVEADEEAPGAEEVPAPAPAEETAADPHPASAEHSSTVSTDPRTWRADIMLL
jgi:hypothetical protein